MNSEDIVKEAIAAWNAKDEGRFVALFSENCEVIAPGYASQGHSGVSDFWDLYMRAFPDNQISTLEIVGDRDVGVQETVFRGTHDGPLRTAEGTSIPPTGKQLAIQYAGIYHLDGKIAGVRYYFDQVDLLTQLGLMTS